MKERSVNRQRAVVTDHQPAEVAEPGHAALDDPAPSVTAQGPTVLQSRLASVLGVRRDQPDAAPTQAAAMRKLANFA